jgi:uncharacterized membrane protein
MAGDKRTMKCQVCGKELGREAAVPVELISEPVAAILRRDRPDWDPAGYVCRDDLDAARAEHFLELLKAERGELTEIEQEIVRSISEQELLSRNVDAEFEERLTFGNRVSDRMAGFGGSWRFIIIFGTVLVAWICLNVIVFARRPFDPYPFILLNLILSCLAAIQAPIIMMSQNRQEQKDRLRARHDYQVNLKAEMEIRALHQKLDHLIFKQWQRLLEIQQIQLDLIEEIRRGAPAVPGKTGETKPVSR